MPKECKSLEKMMEESDRILMKFAEMKHRLQSVEMLSESLAENGESLTLQTLVSLSVGENSRRLNEMLAMLPAVSTTARFFKRVPNYEVDAKTFEYLIKQGVHFI
jgi:hypothetical protein